ncbi:hypothetical protein J7S78_13760 [Klebsiella oxytoca]|uniref:Uncharacterized protein n=1 Tax=Klebsiella oxytoca TaxID=571 RepID=A0AAP2BIB8_KLEOX|nr:hypothetical protein [Klebsiella oxytoca]MBQ0600859.1 hypothetical protein [Klebsiella oxytoca]
MVFFYKNPVFSKLITIFFTALFFIKSVGFAKSDFNDLVSGLAALFYFIMMTITLYAVINRNSIISFNIMEYFVENQDKTATDKEIDFFLRESENSGFKPQFESYLNSLDRKPLIKECMIKCMELSKINVGMDA